MKEPIAKASWRWYIVLFFTLNIFNAMFLLSPLVNNNMNPFRLGALAWINAFLGNFAILSLFLAFVLLLSNKKKTIRNWLFVSTVFFCAISLGLKVYVFYYGSYFSFFIVENFSNPAGEMAVQLTITSLRMMFYEGQFVTLLPVVFMLLYQRLVLRKDIRVEPLFYPSAPRLRRHGAFLFAIGLALMVLTTINGTLFKAGTYFSKHRVPLYGVQTMGAYNYYVNDLFSYLTHGTYVVDETEQAAIDDYLANVLTDPCYDAACVQTDATSPFFGRFAGQDLVLFQLESLNTFLIGLEVNGIPVMPFLSSLTTREDVLYYPNYFSSIGIGKTTDAEFANLTGIYPTGFTVTYFDHIVEGFETVPSLFKQVGYRTMAVHGSPIAFYDRKNVHPLLGFDESFGTEAIDPDGLHQVNGWTDDKTVFAFARNRILASKEAEEAFFLMLLSTVSHLPYFEHPDYTHQIDWGVKDSMATRALDYYRILDDDLRVFFEGLEEDGSLQEVAFLLYGDHSSGLLLDDLNDIVSVPDKQTFQRMLQNVPLIIYTPGVVLEDVDTSLVRSQVDVKRTVAMLYDLPIQRYTGVDILSNRPTLAYNPQTFDIAGDGFFLSATAKIWTPRSTLTIDQAEALISEYYAFKRMNDWILKTEAFRPREAGS